MKENRSERKKAKAARHREKKRKDKFGFRFIIVFVVLFIVYLILKPLTIGSDLRYNIFVVAVPIVLGVILFYNYRNIFFDTDDATPFKNIWDRIGYYALLSLILLMLSLLTFVLTANIIFSVVNYNIAKANIPHQVTVPIEQFLESTKRNSTIVFTFNNNSEGIQTSRENIKEFKAQSHTKKRLRLTLREGLWNHYLVQDWEVVK